MLYRELTQKHLTNLMNNIKAQLSEKGLVVSGSTYDSLEVKENELLADESLYYLVYGRGPGKFPPVQNIRDWVRQKLGVEEKQVNSVAFLVGRKISEQGTNIYNDNSLGVDLDRLIDNMVEELLRELPDAAAKEALNVINNFAL